LNAQSSNLAATTLWRCVWEIPEAYMPHTLSHTRSAPYSFLPYNHIQVGLTRHTSCSIPKHLKGSTPLGSGSKARQMRQQASSAASTSTANKSLCFFVRFFFHCVSFILTFLL
jgi:hypothetical protein